jgi:hypothetical protein
MVIRKDIDATGKEPTTPALRTDNLSDTHHRCASIAAIDLDILTHDRLW